MQTATIDPELIAWFEQQLDNRTRQQFMAEVMAEARETPYAPQGSLVQLFDFRDKQLVVGGPTRTGKTLALCQLMHKCALEYPGMRGLITRKLRTDMTETILVTYEDEVLGLDHPLSQGSRQYRQSYAYPNKSYVVVGGLDQKNKQGSNKIMGGQYDLIIVSEAIELLSTDWDKLLTRLSNGVMPWQSIIGDFNPTYKSHWIKERIDSGDLPVINSTHQDNPIFYNEELGEWTERGKDYVFGTLGKLTGTSALRLAKGLWADNEGVVYDTFSDANITILEPDPFLPIHVWVDDGYHPDPRAMLLVQEMEDGRFLIFDEIVHKKHLAETCVTQCLMGRLKKGWPLSEETLHTIEVKRAEHNEEIELVERNGRMYLKEGWHLPELAIGEGDKKELSLRFRKANIKFRNGKHTPITEGIAKVRRHIQDTQGRRWLLVHKRCKHTLWEIQEGYKYPDGGRKGDVPLDENNHCSDSFRYGLFVRGRK